MIRYYYLKMFFFSLNIFLWCCCSLSNNEKSSPKVNHNFQDTIFLKVNDTIIVNVGYDKLVVVEEKLLNDIEYYFYLDINNKTDSSLYIKKILTGEGGAYLSENKTRDFILKEDQNHLIKYIFKQTNKKGLVSKNILLLGVNEQVHNSILIKGQMKN